jgi:hypothetical protein
MVDEFTPSELKNMSARTMFGGAAAWSKRCESMKGVAPEADQIRVLEIANALGVGASIAHRLDAMNLTMLRILNVLEELVGRDAVHDKAIEPNPIGAASDQGRGDR